MNEVDFDSDLVDIRPHTGARRADATPDRPQRGMAGWLMSKGIAKNVTAATIILLAVVAGAVAVTVFMLRGDFRSAPKPRPLEQLYRIYGSPNP